MVKESIVTFCTQAVLALFSTLSAILTARLLGPEGRGVYTIAVSLIGLLALIGSLGISQANVYFAGRKKYDTSTLLGNSLVGGFILGLLLVLGGRVVYGLIPDALQGVTEAIFWLAAIFIPIILIETYVSCLILGLQRIIANNILALVSRSVGIVALIVALPLFPTVATAIVITLGVSVVRLLANLVYLVRQEKHLIVTINLTAWKNCVIYGVKGQLGNVVQFLNYRMDMFFVNFFAGPQAVGLYSIAVVMAEALWYISNSIAYVLFPKVSKGGDRPESVSLTSTSSRFAFVLTALMALLLGAVAPWVIGLFFGDKFASSVPAFEILLPGITAFSVTNVLASYIAGRGFPHYNTLVAAVSFLFTLILDIILIPRWGINGAALATTVSYVVATIVILFLYRMLSSAPISNALIPKVDDVKLARSIMARYSAVMRRAAR